MSRALPHLISQLDLSQAGVVSILRSLPGDAADWTDTYRVGAMEYTVSGLAPLGRPYGVDADILLAVQTLFARAGFPADGLVDTTGYALLRLAGHGLNGENYARLRECLLRVQAVRWTYSRYLWSVDGRSAIGGTVATGLFAEVILPEVVRNGDPELMADARLKIHLTPTFAQSIRAGSYQLLDAELLEKLDQPGTRSLYRVLQAHRVQPDGSLSGELVVNLRDWLKACAIVGRIDSAKDTLHRAHDSLHSAGYLDSVTWSGRGQKATLTYRFARPHADPELVALLCQWGVSRPGAEALAADHPERVRPAIATLRGRIDLGFKPRNLGAVVTDAVRNPDKYPAQMAAPRAEPAKKPRRVVEAPVAEPDRREALQSAFRIKMGRDLDLYERQALLALDDLGLNALSLALREGNKALALSLLV